MRLLSAAVDPEFATLSELDGAALVQPLSAEALDGVDLMFLCGEPDPAALPWTLAAAGTTTVALASEAAPEGGIPVVSGVNLEAAVPGGLLISPHPAVVLLTLLLDPVRALGLTEAAAWLVQPATMRGSPGLDELMEQTRTLLAFAEERPTAVFGQQLSFNLLPTAEDPAPRAREIAALIGGGVAPAIEILQGAIFHSFTASVLIGFPDDPGGTAIEQALAARPQLARHDPAGGPGPGPIAAAGNDRVLLGPVSAAAGLPGRYWLRAVMDNLTRGGALNAVEIAAAVLGAGEIN